MRGGEGVANLFLFNDDVVVYAENPKECKRISEFSKVTEKKANIKISAIKY